MANVTLVLSRRLERAASTGKTYVLSCIVDAVAGSHDVGVVSLGESTGRAGDQAIGCRLVDTGVGALRGAASGHSLNSSIYDNAAIVDGLRSYAGTHGAPDMVIVDGVRLWKPARRAFRDTPIVAYLDDLLSRRYRSWAEEYSASQFELGALPLGMPRRLQPVAGRALFPFLRAEARRLEREERQIAETADRVVLISPTEARTLTGLTGQDIAWATPPPTDLRGAWSPTGGFDFDAVFVGSSNYLPNRHAIELLERRIAPRLADLLGREPVIGLVGEDSSRRYGNGVQALGFIDRLEDAFDRSRCLAAYGLLPGGVKTKVLHAMAYGLPVIASPGAFEGILSYDDGSALVARSDAGCAEAIARLGADRDLATRISNRSRTRTAEHYGRHQFASRWLEIVESTLAAKHP